MENKKLIKQRFSRFSTSYGRVAEFQRHVAILLTKVADAEKMQGRVLDIGCGTGNIAEITAEYNLKLIQSDISLGMCAQALRHGPAVSADAEGLPFADGSFDHALSALAWQWFPDPRSAFTEAYRVVRGGGSLALAVPVDGTLSELHRVFADFGHGDRIHDFRSMDSIVEGAVASGWTVCNAETVERVERHADLSALLRSVRGIGASNVQSSRKRYFPRRDFADLQRAYALRYGSAQGVAATWNILILILEKPA